MTNSVRAPGWPERLATAGDAVWFYLGELVWPHPLITIYPRWEIDAGQPLSYLLLLATIIVLFLLWLKRESWSRPWFFAFAYFLVALLPALGFVTLSYFGLSFVADHFQYLAGMGPLALVGAGMVKFSKFVIPQRPWLRSSVSAGLLLILGVLSWQRTWAYEGEETLWTDEEAKNPDCWLAYNNLGMALVLKGQNDEAIIQYRKLLNMQPGYSLGHKNLGIALFNIGRVDEAMAQDEEALELNPDFAEAYNDLGLVLAQKGRVDEAIVQYQKALEIKPTYFVAHNNLGTAFFHNGQVDEAIRQFQMALETHPKYTEAHNNLGNALLQKGQLDQAIDQYQKALEIDPDYALGHTNLGRARGQRGIVFLQEGEVDKAIVQFQEALKNDPTLVQAHSNLGIALAQKGQADEALAQFQEALRLKPDDTAAQVNLAKIKAMAQQKAAH